MIVLPELYRTRLKNQLSQAQFLTLEILVWLLQAHKQIKIERLAAYFPLPILFESRRRHIQRFLLLRVLSIPIIWFPIIEAIIKLKFNHGERIYLAIDRTQWKDKNLFLVALIIDRRGIPCGLAKPEKSLLRFPSKKRYKCQIPQESLSTIKYFGISSRHEDVSDGNKSHSISRIWKGARICRLMVGNVFNFLSSASWLIQSKQAAISASRAYLAF
jgi:hypothetical protein